MVIYQLHFGRTINFINTQIITHKSIELNNILNKKWIHLRLDRLQCNKLFDKMNQRHELQINRIHGFCGDFHQEQGTSINELRD